MATKDDAYLQVNSFHVVKWFNFDHGAEMNQISACFDISPDITPPLLKSYNMFSVIVIRCHLNKFLLFLSVLSPAPCILHWGK